MTQQALPAVLAITPLVNSPWSRTTSIAALSTFTFNAAADKVAWIFPATDQVPDLVSFVVTGFTVAGTVDATLETLDAAGLPSGTPVTNSATVSVSVTGNGVFNTAAGMAGTATLTVGDLYAVVLSSAAVFVGSFNIAYGSANTGSGLGYAAVKDSAGAWGKGDIGEQGAYVGLKNASGSYMHIPGFVGAASSVAIQTFSDSTNPDERGNRFSFPVPKKIWGALIGMNAGSTPGANDNYSVSLYTSHTSSRVQQRTKAMDGDAQLAGMRHIVKFATPYEVAANTVVCLAVKADGSETIGIQRNDYQANADLAGFLGTNFYASTANGGGDFTDDNDSVYFVFPLVSHLGDDAGSGGGGGQRVIGA